MITKDDLLSMKYKELVVTAKKHGVYKARSKKVYLQEQLMALFDNEALFSETPTIAGENVSPEKSSAALVRQGTFSIDVPKENLSPEKSSTAFIRQRTFSIDKSKEEILSFGKTGRQRTFSIDKPEDKLSTDKIGRTSILRQNTFSINKPSENPEAEEMPALIYKEVKSSPKIKPFIIKNVTPNNLVKFNSPNRNSHSVPSSSGYIKSIGRRIENKRNATTELRPSSRGSRLQKNSSIDPVSSTPVRVYKTAMKGGRIEKKITPRKLPNFKAIHMREFSKMESIVEHVHRKAERCKKLNTTLNQTPINKLKGNSLESSRIPIKLDLKPKVTTTTSAAITPSKTPILITPNRVKPDILSNKIKFNLPVGKSQVTNSRDKMKQVDSLINKTKRKSDSAAKVFSNSKRVENVKEMVAAKRHPCSIERNRTKGREFLQSVRMNRRFQLQMEVMRKAKV